MTETRQQRRARERRATKAAPCVCDVPRRDVLAMGIVRCPRHGLVTYRATAPEPPR